MRPQTNSKASRKSSSGYSNHSFSHQLDDDDYTSDIYQQLNHRSASMVCPCFSAASASLNDAPCCLDQSTLPSNMPPASYTPVPYSDKTSSVVGMSQPRLSQLQTLEAKVGGHWFNVSANRAPTVALGRCTCRWPASPFPCRAEDAGRRRPLR